MFKSLAREPLVHFPVARLFCHALDAWLRPATTPATASEIVVSETLAYATFRRISAGPGSGCRRARRLDGLHRVTHPRRSDGARGACTGLDRDDAIIRRRLQQKMDFVSEEASSSRQADRRAARCFT